MRGGFTQQRCPKCGGNIFLDGDLYGWFEKCLQCGRTWYLDNVIEVRDKVDEGSSRELMHVVSARQSNS